MDTNTLYILIMVVLLVLSAYFSATETAFSSLNRTRLHTLADKGNKKAICASALAEDYDKLISTILVGNNLVNIAIASLGTVLFVRLYGDIGATISTAVITIAVLTFGEVGPKSIAKENAESFAMFSAPIIKVLMVLFTPLTFLFALLKKLLNKIFPSHDTKMSQDELLMLVDEVQEEGTIDNNEGNLLRNAISFTDLEAEQILTHRVDLEAINVDSTNEQLRELFDQTQFSRILVYQDDIDNIIGVVHLKDLFTKDGITTKSIREIMTPPVFVHSSEKISDLLKILQVKKSHIAVVLDEYGGTLGIVTMEDILEELVGEIWDEHDEVEEDFKKLAPDTYKVACDTSMEDFNTFFDVEIDTESVSVGGWITDTLDKIPNVGDNFTFGNLAVKVTEIDGHRIVSAIVKVNHLQNTEE